MFLAGRTEGPMEAVAADIRAAGGSPELAVLGTGRHQFRAFKLDVLRIEGGRIAEITTFGATLFPAFGFPPTR